MKIGWLRTYTGRYVSLLQPTTEMFCLEDVAHQLSLVPRWGGATSRHFSVAEHSIWTYKLVRAMFPGDDVLALDALLHDCEEAYTLDVQTPHKALLGESWAAMADGIRAKVRESLGLPGTPTASNQAIIKIADGYSAYYEAKGLLAHCPEAQRLVPKAASHRMTQAIEALQMDKEVKHSIPMERVEQAFKMTVEFLLKVPRA